MRRMLLRLKTWWMKFAHLVGWINTRVLLTIVYFVLFALPALIFRLLRKDPLHRRRGSALPSYWQPKKQYTHSAEDATHQF